MFALPAASVFAFNTADFFTGTSSGPLNVISRTSTTEIFSGLSEVHYYTHINYQLLYQQISYATKTHRPSDHINITLKSYRKCSERHKVTIIWQENGTFQRLAVEEQFNCVDSRLGWHERHAVDILSNQACCWRNASIVDDNRQFARSSVIRINCTQHSSIFTHCTKHLISQSYLTWTRWNHIRWTP